MTTVNAQARRLTNPQPLRAIEPKIRDEQGPDVNIPSSPRDRDLSRVMPVDFDSFPTVNEQTAMMGLHDQTNPFPSVEARLIVEVSDTQNHLKVDPRWVERLVSETLNYETKPIGTISVAIVDDSTIQRLNRLHLNHDWPTDVISFVLSDEDDDENKGLEGELILSAEMALRTANAAQIEPLDEFALYLVHGLLHLCGHDDTSEPARSQMRKRETEILRQLGVAHTFNAIEPSPSLKESEGCAS